MIFYLLKFAEPGSSTSVPIISSTNAAQSYVGWWVALGIILVLLCIFAIGTTIWWFFIRGQHAGYNPV